MEQNNLKTMFRIGAVVDFGTNAYRGAGESIFEENFNNKLCL